MLGYLLTCRTLWREDGKLAQTVANGRSEMENAERNLAGMMDKVCSLVV